MGGIGLNIVIPGIDNAQRHFMNVEWGQMGGVLRKKIYGPMRRRKVFLAEVDSMPQEKHSVVVSRDLIQ